MRRPAIRAPRWIWPALLVLAVTAAPSTQDGPAGEWPTYGGDLASRKYSPLAQITGANVGTLRVAWRAPSPDGQLSVGTPGGGTWSGPPAAVFAELQRRDPQRWRDNDPPNINNYKATPLMVDGLLYVNTPTSVGAAYDFLNPDSPVSSPRSAFCNDSWILRPIAITSPTDFIAVDSSGSAPLNFSKAKRGILVTT